MGTLGAVPPTLGNKKNMQTSTQNSCCVEKQQVSPLPTHASHLHAGVVIFPLVFFFALLSPGFSIGT